MVRELAWANYEELPVDESFAYGTRHGISDWAESENLRFSVIRFDPGEGGPLHFHHEQEEFYLVLEGKLDVQMGDSMIEADAGTVLFTPPEGRHQPRNTYDEPAVLLAVSSPNIDPSAESGIEVVEPAE